MSGLPGSGAMVWVGPPLSARGPSFRSVPGAMLFPLVPDGVNPVSLPMALKLTLTVVPVAAVRMSGPLALVFPATMELATVTVPALVVVSGDPAAAGRRPRDPLPCSRRSAGGLQP